MGMYNRKLDSVGIKSGFVVGTNTKLVYSWGGGGMSKVENLQPQKICRLIEATLSTVRSF